MIETVSMAWVKRNARGYFFSPGAMAYFKSRLPETALRNGDRVFFWTSEQFMDEPRRWTLRRLSLVTGDVTTIGEFQAYSTAAQAKQAVFDAAHGQLPDEPEEAA
jgi:hypothetical protein